MTMPNEGYPDSFEELLPVPKAWLQTLADLSAIADKEGGGYPGMKAAMAMAKLIGHASSAESIIRLHEQAHETNG